MPTAVPGRRPSRAVHTSRQAMCARSRQAVSSGSGAMTISRAAGTSVGSTKATTGAAVSPSPKPESPCTREPSTTAAPTTSSTLVVGAALSSAPMGSGGQRAQHVLQDPAVAVVVRLAGGVDAHHRVELHGGAPVGDGVAVTWTVDGVDPSFSAVMPETSKVSVPSSPSDAALWPCGYCRGTTPIPMRLERWMRS